MIAQTFRPPILAASNSMVTMVVSLAVVLALSGALLGLLSLIRRRTREQTTHVPRGFTLADLRDLHREGKLTADEFERAKAKLVSTVHSKLKADAKPSASQQILPEEFKEI